MSNTTLGHQGNAAGFSGSALLLLGVLSQATLLHTS